MDDNLLIAYIEGKTSASEDERILNWILADEANRDYLAELNAIWHACAAPAAHKVAAPRRRLSGKWIARISMAAAIAVGVVFSVFYFSRPEKEPECYVWFNSNPSVMSITLPDGSSVWLDRHTSLSYCEGGDKGVRSVIMQGEAFFDVAKDPCRPFVVETSGLKVKVYGTRFNVRSLPSESFSEVALVEGSVSLADKDERNMIFLTPGQKAHYVAADDYLQVSEVPVDNILLVHYGIESLQNQTLSQILAHIGESYGVSLSCDKDSMEERFTVNYPKDIPLEDVLWTVEAISGSKISITGKTGEK
ncbi:MAG: FecR domain-containing protein [Bacteroidales bacterium]|nr:FecR domain-containing protein [Bacteroidales bacterium]